MFDINFKKLVILLFLVEVVVSQKYKGDYAAINPKEVLSNPEYLDSIIKCYLDEGPCSPPLLAFKSDIPKFIESKCLDCSDIQWNIIKRGSLYLIKNQPDRWDQIMNKYAPEKALREAFVKRVKEA